MAHTIMKAEKSQDLPSASGRPSTAGAASQSPSQPENQGS